ncbi:MAG: radical SAM protein [Candidatus Aenigmatarchaeota archaeon]
MIEYLKILKSILFLPRKVDVYPKHIQLDVTTYCNLKCKMCNSKKIISKEEDNVHLSFDKFKYIIDIIKPKSVNLAANGEPFLNPDIFKMLDYAKKNKVTTIISSNFIISQSLVNEIVSSSSLDILKISIDGSTKETYEKIRGPYFDILTKNVELLNNIKLKLNSITPQLRFDFVIMKDNYKEMVDYLYFAKKFNVYSVYFHPIDSREYDEKQKNEIIYGIDFVLLKKVLKETKRIASNFGIYTNIKSLLDNFDLLEELYLVRERKNKKRCLLPWLSLFISISGETSPCCTMYPDKTKSLGNIFIDDFDKIWNGEKMKLMRKNFRKIKNYDLYVDCRHCMPMDLKTLLNTSLTFPNYFKNFFKNK